MRDAILLFLVLQEAEEEQRCQQTVRRERRSRGENREIVAPADTCGCVVDEHMVRLKLLDLHTSTW
jgi:hypothetical protein